MVVDVFILILLFYVQCQTTNEEEIFDVQDKHSLFPLGWIHVSFRISPFLFFLNGNITFFSITFHFILWLDSEAWLFFRHTHHRLASCHQLIFILITHIRYCYFLHVYLCTLSKFAMHSFASSFVE